MKKLEAMARVVSFIGALRNDDLMGMMSASGLTPELVEDMTLLEAYDAMQVRVADMMRIAGMEFGGEQQ